MMKPGDEIENPTTGERLVFQKTSAETGGAAVVVQTFLRPYAAGTRDHVHPAQEERFEVLHGTVGFRLGERRVVAGAGSRFSVPAGTPHRFWNAGDEEACVISEIRPSLRFEELAAAVFGGLSNRLQLAVVAYAHRGTARPVRPAGRVVLGAAALLGRMLGYRSTDGDTTSIDSTREALG